MLEKRKKLESLKKMGRKNPKPKKKYQNSRGKRMKNQAKILRSERFFSLFKFSIFSPFFSISIPISISKFPKSSISISKSIFRK